MNVRHKNLPPVTTLLLKFCENTPAKIRPFDMQHDCKRYQITFKIIF